MKSARIQLSIVTVAVMLLAACGGSAEAGAQPDGENAQAAPSEVQTVFAVNVTPAIEGEINNYIEVNGDVRASATINVFAETMGELTELRVNVGDTVRTDQVLALVDPSRPGQNFVASPVRAPITGTITQLPVRQGGMVTQSQPVAQIARTDDLEIEVQIAERFISKVERGLPAIIRFDAFPDERFSATVIRLSPVVDPLTRTLTVTIRLDERDPRVRAGMFASVRIVTEQKEGIVKLPSQTMIRRFGRFFVYVVNDDTVEERAVNPGIEIDNKVEITEGLEPNELVVYQGQSLLEDGARVRVIDTITPLSAEDVIQ